MSQLPWEFCSGSRGDPCLGHGTDNVMDKRIVWVYVGGRFVPWLMCSGSQWQIESFKTNVWYIWLKLCYSRGKEVN